jgi:uncharacterized protein Smg (DUF494 family)
MEKFGSTRGREGGLAVAENKTAKKEEKKNPPRQDKTRTQENRRIRVVCRRKKEEKQDTHNNTRGWMLMLERKKTLSAGERELGDDRLFWIGWDGTSNNLEARGGWAWRGP